VYAAGDVLLDTGPLVALFDPSDRDHARCRGELATLGRCRLCTTLASVTEATHLLGFSTRAQVALLTWVAVQSVVVEQLGPEEVGRAAALMEKYSDVPMDFADAALVILAERLGTRRVFTLDSDFNVYRLRRRRFELIPG